MKTIPEKYIDRANAFTKSAHAIFSEVETSPSRLVDVAKTASSITTLEKQQRLLLGEALKCANHGLFRSAHVSAWAALIDMIERRVLKIELEELEIIRPKWKFETLEDLKESATEYQILELAKIIGIIRKNELKSLQGMLSKRNECAHPSDYSPTFNETVGYISEAIQRLSSITSKRSNRTLSKP